MREKGGFIDPSQRYKNVKELHTESEDKSKEDNGLKELRKAVRIRDVGSQWVDPVEPT